jgi:hypothetical protein
MARILEIREICERALRKIGAFSIRDSGADAAELDEARLWLDMVMGHLASRRRAWWLVPATAPVPLVAGQASYTLAAGAGLPAGDPMASAVSAAAVQLADGQRDDVQIARRWEWEARDVTRTGGAPLMIYIDRTPAPQMLVWPTPTEPVTHRLEIVFQRVSPNLTTGTPTERTLQFREAWNLYIVTALAAQIGDGPVRKLPGDEVRAMQMQAERLLFDLEAFDAHEQASEPRLVAYHGF